MVVHSEEDIIELVKFFKKDYNTMDLTNQVKNVVDFVKGTKLSRPISCTEVDVSVHEDSTITIEYTLMNGQFVLFSFLIIKYMYKNVLITLLSLKM